VLWAETPASVAGRDWEARRLPLWFDEAAMCCQALGRQVASAGNLDGGWGV